MSKSSIDITRCGAMFVSSLRDPNIAFIKNVLAPVFDNHRLIYFVCGEGHVMATLAAKIISEDAEHFTRLIVPYPSFRPKVYQQKLFLQDAKGRAELLCPPYKRMFEQHVYFMSKYMLQVFTVHSKLRLENEVDLSEEYFAWLEGGNIQSTT